MSFLFEASSSFAFVVDRASGCTFGFPDITDRGWTCCSGSGISFSPDSFFVGFNSFFLVFLFFFQVWSVWFCREKQGGFSLCCFCLFQLWGSLIEFHLLLLASHFPVSFWPSFHVAFSLVGGWGSVFFIPAFGSQFFLVGVSGLLALALPFIVSFQVRIFVRFSLSFPYRLFFRPILCTLVFLFFLSVVPDMDSGFRGRFFFLSG